MQSQMQNKKFPKFAQIILSKNNRKTTEFVSDINGERMEVV